MKTDKDIAEIAKNIKLLILDVDGVLTDGSIIIDSKGNEIKNFNVRDGHGIKLLIKKGVHVSIISGRYSKVVDFRAEELGIKDVYLKSHNKDIPYRELKKKLSIEDEEIAFIGDDIVDIPVLKQVGLPVAVADSADEIREYAAIITKNPGGRGAVREICDLLLKSKGFWQEIMNEYSGN